MRDWIHTASLQDRIIAIFLALWILTSLVALAGMGHLWWTRERVLYGNKDIYEQRIEVCKRAGISLEILKEGERIDRTWPRYLNYKAVGNHDQLSYVKYLLIPRIPSGEGNILLTEKDGKLYTNTDYPEKGLISGYPSKVSGFLLSFLSLWGMVILGRRYFGMKNLSFPEGIALVCLLLTLFTLLSRSLSGTATYGFWLTSALGICGWVVWSSQIPDYVRDFRDKRYLDWGRYFHEGRFLNIALILFIFIIVMVFLWSILMSVVVVPDDWDAWAIWGAKAKVLALGQGPLLDVTHFDQADYPLLWPSLWAFSGWWAGGWEENWSRAWGPIFMLLCACEIGIIIQRLSHNKTLGFLGAALFVSIPMVPLISSWSYAEAPLWLMMICSFGYLLSWRKEGQWQQMIVSGLFAAAAAYTKNEGLFYASLGLIWILSCRPKNLFIACVLYITPLLLLYTPWFLWIRTALHLKSHALLGLNLDYHNLVRALHRLMPTAKSIAIMWADVRQWNIVLWGLLLSSVYLGFVKGNDGRSRLLVPVLMLFSSFIIVIFHPSDVHWLVAASWNRITTQTLPLFLVVIIPSLSMRADSRNLTHED